MTEFRVRLNDSADRDAGLLPGDWVVQQLCSPVAASAGSTLAGSTLADARPSWETVSCGFRTRSAALKHLDYLQNLAGVVSGAAE